MNNNVMAMAMANRHIPSNEAFQQKWIEMSVDPSGRSDDRSAYSIYIASSYIPTFHPPIYLYLYNANVPARWERGAHSHSTELDLKTKKRCARKRDGRLTAVQFEGHCKVLAYFRARKEMRWNRVETSIPIFPHIFADFSWDSRENAISMKKK